MNYKHKTTGIQAKLAEDGKYYIHNCSIGIPKQFIEDSKVWLKVEDEKDYEILSFSSGYAGAPRAYIFKKLPNGLYSKGTGDCTLEHGLTYWDIFSIKRLSDNVVFSVGDKIKFSKNYKGFNIEKITLKDNRLELYGDGLFCSVVESNVYKLLPVILTTEDSVELFGGESIFAVSDDFELLYNSYATKSNVQGVRIFAKKENAETFIKENKPQYSLNDIRKVLTKEMKCSHWAMIDVDKIIKDLENEETSN